MTSRQQIKQMQHYWTDLDHSASDDTKKKSMDKKFGLVSYNDCLYRNKQLALGNDLTGPDDGDVRVASNIDKLKNG